MDFDLKMKALSRLAKSRTEMAELALRKELNKVAASLELENQYDHLAHHLEVLDTIGHRFSTRAVEIILAFIVAIESRHITYATQDRWIESEIAKYQNASTLIVRGVEILNGLRYSETKSVLHALLNLSGHKFDDVRAETMQGLKALAGYAPAVFSGIGARPQNQIIDEIELLPEGDLKKWFSAILVLLNELLAPTMHGTSWSYKTVTLSRGPTPALPTVGDIRHRSIELLKRMYELTDALPRKLAVISTLNNATRRHDLGTTTEDTAKMIVRDSVNVLEFFTHLTLQEDLPIIQQIESRSYWIYYHAISEEIKTAALTVRDAIHQHSEYQIYKILIGFEGVFGDWPELKNDDGSGEEVDKFRKEKASEYAASVTSDSYPKWRQRILEYSQTESNDLATFPVFCHFLEAFAGAQPKLALQLMATDSEPIKGFLIPLLRSLWAGPEQSAIRGLVTSWVEKGLYLRQSTRQFIDNEYVDRDLLTFILRRATELEDVDTVAATMSVAVSNYSSDKSWLVDELFLPALEMLTERSNTHWIFDFWFRRTSRTILRDLSEQGVDLILRNLLALDKIDYHAEEVLYHIAQRTPQKVLYFLCERLAPSTQAGEILSSPFDAIPYRLHKLNEPLSKIPGEAVRTIRGLYDGNYSMFIFRGARLLKIIFPEFHPEFEAELLRVVRVDGEANLEFALAVLRNYEGEPFIHNLCKEIIKLLPSDSPFLTEVAVALENSGVVTGEFGRAEAYERKMKEVSDWVKDPDARVQEFAKRYMANLEGMSVAERKRAEEEIALRKHRFGEQ